MPAACNAAVPTLRHAAVRKEWARTFELQMVQSLDVLRIRQQTTLRGTQLRLVEHCMLTHAIADAPDASQCRATAAAVLSFPTEVTMASSLTQRVACIMNEQQHTHLLTSLATVPSCCICW
jgi:hypothetical protein